MAGTIQGPGTPGWIHLAVRPLTPIHGRMLYIFILLASVQRHRRVSLLLDTNLNMYYNVTNAIKHIIVSSHSLTLIKGKRGDVRAAAKSEPETYACSPSSKTSYKLTFLHFERRRIASGGFHISKKLVERIDQTYYYSSYNSIFITCYSLFFAVGRYYLAFLSHIVTSQ